MSATDTMGATVLAHLRQFDRGIAPTMSEIVNVVLAEYPQWSAFGIRRCVSALEQAGEVASRWDQDAHVYWAPRGS